MRSLMERCRGSCWPAVRCLCRAPGQEVLAAPGVRSRWPFVIACTASMAHSALSMSFAVNGFVWAGRMALGTAALLLVLAVVEALRLE